MRKILALLLVGVLATGTLSALATSQPQEKEQKPAAPQKLRWRGIIVLFSKDKSSLDVSKGATRRTIYYDNSTLWVKAGKPAEMSEFKEGSQVRIRGKVGENGRFVATKITLVPTGPSN